MEQRIPALVPSGSAPSESYFVPTPPVSSLGAVSRFVPTTRQRAALKAQLGCVALTFAALILVAAYILVPLAMAVHFAVSVVVLAWGIAAAILLEVFLLMVFIIHRTEGQEQGDAPSNGVP